MAIEIIPKKAPKLPSWLNILLYFSLFLLVSSISSYFILAHLQKESEANLANLEKTLTEGRTLQNIALEEEVFDYQKKISAFSQLISQHLLTSNLFDFLERNCHPEVLFQKFNLDSRTRRLTLSGQTDDFSSLGQQLLILKSQDEIEEVNLAKISLGGKGEVEFTLNLSLIPEIFQW
jgi:methylaspartate ammonia-lyase